jgi:hypothetical protein
MSKKSFDKLVIRVVDWLADLGEKIIISPPKKRR